MQTDLKICSQNTSKSSPHLWFIINLVISWRLVVKFNPISRNWQVQWAREFSCNINIFSSYFYFELGGFISLVSIWWGCGSLTVCISSNFCSNTQPWEVTWLTLLWTSQFLINELCHWSYWEQLINLKLGSMCAGRHRGHVWNCILASLR